MHRCEELGSSGEEDMDTNFNTEKKLNMVSSEGMISKALEVGMASDQLQSPESTERENQVTEPNMSVHKND